MHLLDLFFKKNKKTAKINQQDYSKPTTKMEVEVES